MWRRYVQSASNVLRVLNLKALKKNSEREKKKKNQLLHETKHTISDCDWSSDMCSSDLPFFLKETFFSFSSTIPNQTLVSSTSREVEEYTCRLVMRGIK